MARRLPFLVIVLFWVVMNGLLWESEYRGQREAGSRIPAGIVWQKILTAPDDSALSVFHGGVKRGYCRWIASVGGEEPAGKGNSQTEPLEGRVRELTGYSIDLQGNLALEEKDPPRFRFDFHTDFGTNHVWKSFSVRSVLRPTVWEIKAVNAQETLSFVTEEAGQRWERVFTFEELRHPEKLLDEFGLPWLRGFVGSPDGVRSGGSKLSLASSVRWEASYDWLRVGHSRVKVYRLQGTVLEKYRILIFVSKVGELLRVELPGDWLLLSDVLVGFNRGSQHD